MKYRFTDKAKKHLHELAKDDVNYAPLYGTTTVINECYPPPLAWYGSGKALEKMGFITEKKMQEEIEERELTKEDRARIGELVELERRGKAETGLVDLRALLDNDLTLEGYMDFLEDCYRNHDEYKKSRGKQGVDAHEVLETYVKWCIKNNGGKPHPPTKETVNPILAKFIDWAMRDVDTFLFAEVHCFSEKLWVGGRLDLIFKHKNGAIVLHDNKPAAYPKHFIQNGGYILQIEENGVFTAEGEKLGEIPKFDAMCVYDYEKGVPHYLGGEWVAAKKAHFAYTITMYKERDLIGTNLLVL